MLLAIRAAMVLALAVLGATPLVQCERLSLARDSGASVALAIVMDDSLSMRATLAEGGSRFERARRGATELLNSARDGDAIAIVLGGKPARVALASTTDLTTAKAALADLAPSDRPTDLRAATQLARAAIRSMPQVDKRVVVLSDLSDEPLPEGDPPVWTPLDALTAPVNNCGIIASKSQGRRVSTTVACTSDQAANGRKVTIRVDETSRAAATAEGDGGATPSGETLGEIALKQRAGEQVLVVDLDVPAAGLAARLSGDDVLDHDDTAPISAAGDRLAIGVVADRSRASVITGGPTVIEQALAAVGDNVARPLPLVPEDKADYAGLAALIVDDPPGLSPAARSALIEFIERGGVAVALLGPNASSLQLASTLEPFATGAVPWESSGDAAVDPETLGWLGAEATSLVELAQQGRARLEGSEVAGSRVLGKWTDGVPLVAERRLRRGLVFTWGLPASVDRSDFALRPGFLAFVDRLVQAAAARSGPRHSIAGARWEFPSGDEVSIRGPSGALVVESLVTPCADDEADCDAGHRAGASATPGVIGRYIVTVNGVAHERVVSTVAEEITRQPVARDTDTQRLSSSSTATVDVSREFAWLLLALFVLELGVRLVRRQLSPSRAAVSPPA